MKAKFGLEIETISKEDHVLLADIALGILGSKVDTQNHSYHSHDINRWGFEQDGSLFGRDGVPYGVEIISPPLKIHELGDLKKLLKAFKGKIKVNSSCGLHVHVEINSVASIKNVLKIWSKFEDTILKTFPVSRRNNHYAQPINSLSRRTMLSTNYQRYYMINCRPYISQGTIEFRGHSGTVNYHKIKRWLLFCLAIIERAKDFERHERRLTGILNRDPDIWDFLGINGKTKNYFIGRTKHFEKE